MIEAIILAAGSSRRMGNENKLLKPYKNEVIISQVVKQVLASKASKVIVVTGHQDQAIQMALEGLPIDIVHNTQHLRGQLWSIRAGVGLISHQAQGIMIVLGDMPLLTSDHINTVADYFTSIKSAQYNTIVRPIQGSNIGHPTIWDSSLKSEILAFPHDDSLKGLIRRFKDSYKPLEVQESAFFKDIDTAQDYQQLEV